MMFARFVSVACVICLGTQAIACEAYDAIKNGKPTEGSVCTEFLGEDGQAGRSCYWQFAFRSARATSFADAVWEDYQSCLAGVALDADQLVNHPDSYDLRTWVTEEGNFSVSVKDKGQLDQTLVFLRFEGNR